MSGVCVEIAKLVMGTPYVEAATRRLVRATFSYDYDTDVVEAVAVTDYDTGNEIKVFPSLTDRYFGDAQYDAVRKVVKEAADKCMSILLGLWTDYVAEDGYWKDQARLKEYAEAQYAKAKKAKQVKG